MKLRWKKAEFSKKWRDSKEHHGQNSKWKYFEMSGGNFLRRFRLP